jgi:hypothetical protein
MSGTSSSTRHVVSDIVSTGTVLLGGIWWISNRRAEVARKEGRRR